MQGETASNIACVCVCVFIIITGHTIYYLSAPFWGGGGDPFTIIYTQLHTQKKYHFSFQENLNILITAKKLFNIADF